MRRTTNQTDTTHPNFKYIEKIPALFRNYISAIIDVLPDGHCGFRAIANIMGFGEDSWSRVRYDLLYELRQNIALYDKIFLEHGRVAKVEDKLNYFENLAPKKYWMCLPEMGHLIATVYNVALVTLSTQSNSTFLPLKTSVPQDPKIICIALVVINRQGHFVQVRIIHIILVRVL